ncbi:STAS domain-containing protein [Streptomyces sp. NPDC047023]|uniref:STAS domain-containing protein n=1 Tax=Streptomyces sp. NPDC047023 TaxID=3155139 RepID=UPI0033D86510
MSFTTRIQCREEVALVCAAGLMDTASEEALADCAAVLSFAAVRSAIFDLHEVRGVDAHGLLLLLDLHRRLEDQGQRVVVTGWQEQPQQFIAALARAPLAGAPIAFLYQTPGFRSLLSLRARELVWEPLKPMLGAES